MDNQICSICGNKISRDNFGTLIEKLGLSGRVYNCLKRREIDFVEQLVKLKPDDILRFRNMGIMALKEIKQKLKAFGIKWLWDADA